VGDYGLGREPALDETAVGPAFLECLGNHPKGKKVLEAIPSTTNVNVGVKLIQSFSVHVT